MVDVTLSETENGGAEKTTPWLPMAERAGPLQKEATAFNVIGKVPTRGPGIHGLAGETFVLPPTPSVPDSPVAGEDHRRVLLLV